MFISGPWMMSAVEKAGGKGFKDKYAVVRDAGRRRRPPRSSVAPNLAVFKNTKNRDSAWKLVKWLSDPKTQVKWYQHVDRPALGHLRRGRTRPSPPTPSSPTFGKQLETAQAPPSFPTWEQVVASSTARWRRSPRPGATRRPR